MKKKPANRMHALIDEINLRRHKQGLRPVVRQWSGCAHWLQEPLGLSSHYRSMGGMYASDEGFIGFLEGLLHDQPQGDPDYRRRHILEELSELRTLYVRNELTEDFIAQLQAALVKPEK